MKYKKIAQCIKQLFAVILMVHSVNHQLTAQLSQIPFTRNDSARIYEYDSLYNKFMQQNNLMEASRQLDLHAMLLWQHNHLNEALLKFKRSLKLNESLGNQNGIAGINSNLAFIYTDMQQYDTAFQYFEMTLAVRRAAGKPVGIISTLVNQSVVLNHLLRFDESVERLEEALRFAREMNDETQMRSVYGMLSETWQKAGNAEKALYYYGFYKTFNDYVTKKQVQTVKDQLELHRLEKENLRLENQNKELQLERQKWQLSKQSEELIILSTEQQQLIDSLSVYELANQLLLNRNIQQQYQTQLLVAEKQRDRVFLQAIIALTILIAALLLMSLMILRHRGRLNRILKTKNAIISNQSIRISTKNTELEKVNKLLSLKNDEILSSIAYSEHIQRAVINHNVPLEELFSDVFLFHSPSAIVSGDFYYCRRTLTGDILLLVGDCTGHGVPGAFLTIFATLVLDRAVFDKKLSSCKEILHALDYAFSDLNRHDTQAFHSMDLSVCLINEAEQTFEYSGIKNGLVIVQDGEIQYLKGNRYILGNLFNPFPNMHNNFTVQRIDMSRSAWYYMFSDGIPDQFGADGKKFSIKRLRNILLSNAHNDAQKQLELLTNEVKTFQNDEPQTDDMILIGFQVP